MKNKHINIPIFIPHLGCPNNCVFCNQRYISGVSEFDPESVIPIIEASLATAPLNSEIEIAFFGGSFTGIDRDLMVKLLSISKSYLDIGKINSVRCSTRPDYIDDEIISILLKYGMTTVELGLQSSLDHVLLASGRGHTREDEVKACRLIKASGMRLGGQMMIGLPGSSVSDEIETAEFIVSMGCDEARIYPTVVFKNTELCNMAINGAYTALALDDACRRSAAALDVLYKGNVRILRIGLCESENLRSDETYFAGPNHPALGDLVENEYYYSLIKDKLNYYNVKNKLLYVFVAPGAVSKAVGQNRINKHRILREYGCSDVKFRESSDVSGYDVLLKTEERKKNVLKVT